MKKRLMCGLVACGLCVMYAAAAGDPATIVSDPSPIKKDNGFTVTITLDKDYGSTDVCCYTWAVCGGKNVEVATWDDVPSTPKLKMSGSGGVYTLSVDNIKSFYGLTDAQEAVLEKLGFIARQGGSQTQDCFVEVVSPVYSGGEGTPSDPYQISTAADLSRLSATPADWGASFVLTADITGVGDFAGIGSMENPFTGDFDGGRHTVEGVKVASTEGVGSATGFFNALGGNASVHDLGLKHVTVSGATFCGALAGYVASGTIERCYTSGVVNGNSICIGGFAGQNCGTISDCYSTANVISHGDYAAGGLVGKNTGTVQRTYASGDVTGHNYVGAVVGANYGTVLRSVAMNLHIVSSAGAAYAGRFGGNNNAENTVTESARAAMRASAPALDLTSDTNLSWSGMTHSQEEWGDAAHHGVTADQLLGDKATYSETLGWDFGDTWTWVGNERSTASLSDADKRYPVLAGIEGQDAPGSAAFYEMTAIEVIGADTACGIEVFPTLVENTISVSAPAAIAALHVSAMNGAAVVSAKGNGSRRMELDMSELTPGVYFLSVTAADGSHATVKLVKK